MPYFALPFSLPGVSSRRVGLPRMRKSFGSFSDGFSGTGILAATPTSAPYATFLPLLWITWLASVRHSSAGTFHCVAAAATSIWRAAAPAWRSGSQCARTVVEPPVACMPNIGLA